MRERKPARTVALYGMLIALAFIFSYVEALIPVPVPVPGIKLGLANLVNVVGLYTVGAAGTAAVSLVRIVLVGFTFSNLFTMLYSLAGGAASLAVMIPARKSGLLGTCGVSILPQHRPAYRGRLCDQHGRGLLLPAGTYGGRGGNRGGHRPAGRSGGGADRTCGTPIMN